MEGRGSATFRKESGRSSASSAAKSASKAEKKYRRRQKSASSSSFASTEDGDRQLDAELQKQIGAVQGETDQKMEAEEENIATEGENSGTGDHPTETDEDREISNEKADDEQAAGETVEEGAKVTDEENTADLETSEERTVELEEPELFDEDAQETLRESTEEDQKAEEISGQAETAAEAADGNVDSHAGVNKKNDQKSASDWSPSDAAERQLVEAGVPEDQRRLYYQAYSRLERGRGHVTPEDMYTALQLLGQCPQSQEEVRQQLAQHRGSLDGELSLTDFATFCASVCRSREAVRAELEASFRVFDTDGSGYLDRRELHRALFGDGDGGEDFEELAQLADTNGDGKIDCAEFCRLVTMGMDEMRQQRQAGRAAGANGELSTGS